MEQTGKTHGITYYDGGENVEGAGRVDAAPSDLSPAEHEWALLALGTLRHASRLLEEHGRFLEGFLSAINATGASAPGLSDVTYGIRSARVDVDAVLDDLSVAVGDVDDR